MTISQGCQMRRRAYRPGVFGKSMLKYILLTALVMFTALPLVYIVVSALKPLDELFLYPPRFYVEKPTLSNFTELFRSMDSSVVPFTRYIFNSLVISVVSVFLTVVVCSMGAYSLAKLKFPGSSLMFNIVIAALMFGPHVTQIPSFIIVRQMHLIDTYWVLILPKIAVAYNLFLLKQFAEQIPDSLLEAAEIDGAREGRVFYSIVMPILRPAWATVVVFSFVSTWNDYFSPLIFIQSQKLKTLPLALQMIGSGGSLAKAGAMAAATFLTTLPTILVFVAMQGRVIKTMAYSGIKA